MPFHFNKAALFDNCLSPIFLPVTALTYLSAFLIHAYNQKIYLWRFSHLSQRLWQYTQYIWTKSGNPLGSCWLLPLVSIGIHQLLKFTDRNSQSGKCKYWYICIACLFYYCRRLMFQVNIWIQKECPKLKIVIIKKRGKKQCLAFFRFTVMMKTAK